MRERGSQERQDHEGGESDLAKRVKGSQAPLFEALLGVMISQPAKVPPSPHATRGAMPQIPIATAICNHRGHEEGNGPQILRIS